MTVMNDAIDLDAILDDAFSMPDDVEASAQERAAVSIQRIVKAIEALGTVADDLDPQPQLTMLHDTLDGMIAKIPADDRGPVEDALFSVLKNGKAAEDFLSKIPAPTVGPVFAPYTFDDILALPPKEWLLDQVFGKSDIGSFYGQPGCGKTLVIIDMIMALCAGHQWAIRFRVARPLNVAYCAGEGISGLPARFKAAAHHHGITKLPNFTFYKTVPQLFNNEKDPTIATIRQLVIERKQQQAQGQADPLDLLFIDTLHTATVAADENSAQDMGKVLHACRWAAAELGCAIVLVHHTGKNGVAERGSSALRGAADFMIEIKRISPNGTKAVMHCSKLKDGEEWKDQTLDLVSIDGFDSVRVWWDEPSDGTPAKGKKADDKAAIKAEMERYPGKRFAAKRLAEAIAQADNYTRKLLSELEKDGECKRELHDPSKGQSPSNPWVYFVEALQNESVSP